MGIPTFTPGYPPDNSTLGQTKSVLRDNINGTFLTLAVDHIDNNGNPGSKPAGYHKVIHEVTQTSVNTVPGVNQIFSGVPGTLVVNSITTPNVPNNGDTQLYSLSGNGGLSQLTGYSALETGFAWVGGILFQWGVTDSTGSNTPISFITNFRNIFTVVATRQQNAGNSTSYGVTNLSLAGFNFQATSAASGVKINWIAIGN